MDTLNLHRENRGAQRQKPLRPMPGKVRLSFWAHSHSPQVHVPQAEILPSRRNRPLVAGRIAHLSGTVSRKMMELLLPCIA